MPLFVALCVEALFCFLMTRFIIEAGFMAWIAQRDVNIPRATGPGKSGVRCLSYKSS